MRYLISVYLALVVGAIVGGAIGFGVQQAIGQEGWWLVVGALGACAGAFWAAMLRADGRVIWSPRRAASAPPAGGEG